MTTEAEEIQIIACNRCGKMLHVKTGTVPDDWAVYVHFDYPGWIARICLACQKRGPYRPGSTELRQPS